jgi:hypothetical protein
MTQGMYEATFGAASAAASASRAASSTGSRAASSAAEVAQNVRVPRGILRPSRQNSRVTNSGRRLTFKETVQVQYYVPHKLGKNRANNLRKNAAKLDDTNKLFQKQIKSIVENGDPNDMDELLLLNPELTAKLKDLLDPRTVKKVAMDNNLEMSVWLLKNVKNKAVFKNTLDGLLEGNHHSSVGRVFEKVEYQDLQAPFAILKEAFESSLSNGKLDNIQEITKLLSKYSRGTKDLGWIRDMSIKIKDNAPETIKYDLFDKFVKSVSWDEPMFNRKFYKVLEGVQDSPELASRWIDELVNPQRQFRERPAVNLAYQYMGETQNKVLEDLIYPLTSYYKLHF